MSSQFCDCELVRTWIHSPAECPKKAMTTVDGVCSIAIGRQSPVSHPPHYNQGKIEVIEFIEDKKLNFHRGNAVKYISRAGIKNKDKEIEDLEKAIWYLRREIINLKGESIRPNDMGTE